MTSYFRTRQISVPAKGNITYNYDASGAKLSKTVTEGSSVKTTLYLGDMVFENDMFLFAGHEEGRLRKAASGAVAYDYFIKDHLGNTRMVLTDETNTQYYPTLSAEGGSGSGEANNQNAIWDDAAGNSIDIVNRRVNRPGNFGTTGTNGNYAFSITKNGGSIGAGKLLKVMSGDNIYSSVDYFYHNNYADNSSANGLGSILNHIAGVIAGTRSPAGTAVKTANSAAAGSLGADGLFTGVFAPQSPSGGYTYQPKAYMHILLFDEQFKFDAANSYVVQVSAWVQESRQTLYGSASAKKNGYAYIYFSNESNDVVFFDNFNLTHQAGPLLEETHYYPFGLTMGGVSSKAAGALENDKKYNGIELIADLGLATYDAFFRNLDPQIGRWWQIDPKIENMELWSPYASNYNNPIRFSDPLGDEPCCEELWKDIKSAVKETATATYNGAVRLARTFNAYLNPIASIVEVVTGKSTESDFTDAKPRSISGMEAAISIIPGAKLEGALIKASEVAVEKAAIKTAVGTEIKGFTKHGVERAIERGVKPAAIHDAIKNPLKVGEVVTDKAGRQSQRYVGKTAETVVNPQTGKIISVNPTSTKKAEALIKNANEQ